MGEGSGSAGGGIRVRQPTVEEIGVSAERRRRCGSLGSEMVGRDAAGGHQGVIEESVLTSSERGSAHDGIHVGQYEDKIVGGSAKNVGDAGCGTSVQLLEEEVAYENQIMDALLCDKSPDTETVKLRGSASSNSAPDMETVKSGSTSRWTVSADMLGTIECGDAGRRCLGHIMSVEEREADRNRKINAIVFREKISPVDIARTDIAPHRPVAFCHNRFLTEKEEVTAILEVKEPDDTTVSTYSPPARMGKKLGIDPDVWQGTFTVPMLALSGNHEIDQKNAAIAEAYNTISMVLRTKYLSALFSQEPG